MDVPAHSDRRLHSPKWQRCLSRSLLVSVLIVFGVYLLSLYVPLHAPELLLLPVPRQNTDHVQNQGHEPDDESREKLVSCFAG